MRYNIKLKQQALEELYRPYRACQECPLGSLGRTHVVFGEGDPDAAMMIIGEGPGAQEDKEGRPFIGRSGKLLTSMLANAGLQREDVFITSIVKCRPPGNRAPTTIESNTCINLLLLQQIQIVQPLIICTLGSIATQCLLGRPVKIAQIRGTPLYLKKFIIVPTFHPAYALRDPKNACILEQDLKDAAQMLYSPNKS